MVLKVPDPPYIAAGALGGPAVIYLVTPMRNALTLGALDSSKSAIRLYRDVFRGGALAGFAGGHYMSIAAMPGFLVLGPCFHMFKDACGGSSTAAVALTAVAESAIFYGSETKNAQIAFNRDAEKKGSKPIAKLQNQYVPFGSGIGIHIARNYLAMSGLRILSDPIQSVLNKASPDMAPGSRAVLGDMLANIVVSALSTPFHQLYGFSVTNHAAALESGSQASIASTAKEFLKSQYLTSSGRISSVAARDVFLRVAYNATIFTLYGSIERSFVANWPKQLNWN